MSSVFEYRLKMKQLLMKMLYGQQLVKWNARLKKLQERNCSCWGRKEPHVIFYNNKRWRQVGLDNWIDPNHDNMTLLLHPDFPDLAEEMAIVADELTEIHEERYEVERFLSNIFLFPAPPELFHQILGESLYNVVKGELQQHAANVAMMAWNPNEQVALETYLKANAHIVKAMNKRLLLNLVTLDRVH